MGVFTIKGAKDCVYMHKILHPHDFENDYMSCKDYNLMKSLSKCLYIYEFSSKWILCNFDMYRVSKFWMSFILCKTKPLILKFFGWPYINDYEGMVSLKFWIYFLF
jgi:hypothetical protein